LSYGAAAVLHLIEVTYESKNCHFLLGYIPLLEKPELCPHRRGRGAATFVALYPLSAWIATRKEAGMAPFLRRPASKATLAIATLLALVPACAYHDDREWKDSGYEASIQTDRDSVGRERTSPAIPVGREERSGFIGHRAADHALRMIGTPYRYGGNSPSSGFDCSGLVQFSYRQAGATLPRTTDALRQVSGAVKPSSLRRGDLVFFHQEGKRNGHVGIYLGAGEFIHAPSSGGRVRRESLQSPYWRKHFSQARRIAA
jgi:cell wall-associated NlpC family hydrolase